jgi:hypothetical protein
MIINQSVFHIVHPTHLINLLSHNLVLRTPTHKRPPLQDRINGLINRTEQVVLGTPPTISRRPLN